MPSLKNPENLLWALGLMVVLWLVLSMRRTGRRNGLYFPGFHWLGKAGPGRYLARFMQGMILVAVLVLGIALADPVYRGQREEVSARGVDIVLVLDISTSMSARDFKPVNRLETAKAVLRKFIDDRPHDRLALITFAADAYVQCPLTADHYTLKALLDAVELIPFDADGTAIGMALASAVNRLRGSPAAGKVIVLLTDGVNNRGEISPLQAAEFCRQFGLRVYTVGIGSQEETEVLARGRDGRGVWVKSRVEFDPETLARIASLTGGQSFVAADGGSLNRIYSEIDGMEKTVLETRKIGVEKNLAPILVLIAVGTLLVVLVLGLLFPFYI